MTQQTKRAPGRPKSTQAKAQPSVEVKKPPIIRKEKEVTTKIYSMDGGGIAHLMKSSVTVFDEESGRVRLMRYCPNEHSVWAEEQSGHAIVQPIYFKNKKLIVSMDKPNLQMFLDLHPKNKANGGNVFSEVQQTKNKEAEMVSEFSVHDAVSLVRDKDIEELLPVALYNGIDVNRSVSDIRYDLLQLAKKNPSTLIDSFDSPVVKARAAVYQADQYNIISLRKEGAYWHDTNKLIVANPTGQDCIETMTRFCLTEKGSVVLTNLNDRLEALA